MSFRRSPAALCAGPGHSVSAPGALPPLPVSGPDAPALSESGPRRSLRRGPALSVSGHGALCRALPLSVSGHGALYRAPPLARRFLCSGALCKAVCRALALSVSGPGGLCVGHRRSPSAMCVGARRSLAVSGPNALCVGAPLLSVSGPGALSQRRGPAVAVSGPGTLCVALALCVGARRSLRRGPALSV